MGKTIQSAAQSFLEANPLVPSNSESQRYSGLADYVNRFITSVSARCMVGTDADQHPELINMFLKFNDDVDKVIGLGAMLPSWLSFVANIPMNKSYNKFRKVFIPIIEKRRRQAEHKDANGVDKNKNDLPDFMPFILDVVDEDNRASDLVAITVWIGLRNLQITLLSTLLDIVDVPGLADKINASLATGASANLSNLDTFTGTDHTSWAALRSAMFESIRLCGPATGPARIISAEHDVSLASDPKIRLPPGEVATLSSFYSHRMPENYGSDAKDYRADRFLKKGPDIGQKRFITWGFGPHTCPGRWFTQEAICVMMKELLERYEFAPERTGLADDEKYEYHAGVVTRKEVPVVVSTRASPT